jgi:hypothetical protein
MVLRFLTIGADHFKGGGSVSASLTINSSRLARFGIAKHRWNREAIKTNGIGGMHRNQLTLKVGRQFGYFNTVFTADARDLVAVGAAFGGLF